MLGAMGQAFGSGRNATTDEPAIVSPPIIVPGKPDEPVNVRPIVINVTCLDARNVPANEDDSYDAHFEIEMTADGFSKQSATTKTRCNNSPIWRQGFNFSCHPNSVENATLSLSLYVGGGTVVLGTISKSVQDITQAEYIDERFEFGQHIDCTARIVFEVADWGESAHVGPNRLHRRSSTQADTQAAHVEGFTGNSAAFGRTGSCGRTVSGRAY